MKLKSDAIRFDWEFCRRNCPYIFDGDEHPRMVREFSFEFGTMSPPREYSMKFHVLSKGVSGAGCIDIGKHSFEDFYRNCQEIKRRGVREFLRRHADIATMARKCPIYAEMMVHAMNNGGKNGRRRG